MDEILNIALDLCVQKDGGERDEAYARAAEQREREGEVLYGERYLTRDNVVDGCEELYDAANYARFLVRQKAAVLSEDALSELQMEAIGACTDLTKVYRRFLKMKRFVQDNEE